MVTPIPLAEFRSRVAALYRAAGRAPKTAKQVDHVLRLAEAAGVRTTAGLTTDAMARIVLGRGAGANPNTTRGLLGRLRRVARLAIRMKLLERDEEPDWGSLWPRAAPPTRNRPHRAEEVARLLEWLVARRGDWYQGRLHALASLVAFTGLRRGEALHSRAEDVDLSRGFVFVVPRVGHRLKTAASAAPVPLPDALVPTLAQWVPRCGGEWLFPGARSGRPWHGGSPGYRPVDRLRQAGEACGVAGVGFHSLRHTLATCLLRDGTPLWAIQRVLRHTTPLTTEHYLHPSDHDVARLVRGFSYATGTTQAGRAAG